MARILIVAGGGEELSLRKRVLEEAGYEVDWTSTSYIALRMASELTFDLILVDSWLSAVALKPELDLVCGLRQRQKGKILIMSYFREPEAELKRQYQQAGASGFANWPGFESMPRFVERYLKER